MYGICGAHLGLPHIYVHEVRWFCLSVHLAVISIAAEVYVLLSSKLEITPEGPMEIEIDDVLSSYSSPFSFPYVSHSSVRHIDACTPYHLA